MLSKEGVRVTLQDENSRKALLRVQSSFHFSFSTGPSPSSPLRPLQATFSNHELPKLKSALQHFWLLSSGHTPHPTGCASINNFNWPQVTVFPLCGHFCTSSAMFSGNWLPTVRLLLICQLQITYYSCNSEMMLQICSGLNQTARSSPPRCYTLCGSLIFFEEV